ncbi:MAG: helix-turn-helix transcriptional regulator [Nocardiopsaceae bacterium]|nr:helix-turn-helix transcriptional regulator [Nocardiopsaceae bacterium]
MSEVAKVYPLGRQPGVSARSRPEPQPPESQPPEPLWREVLGRRLRALRAERGETLAETAERAGISPQYLSEVERGRKEPSSEMIAALAGSLGATLADLTADVAGELRAFQVIGNRASRLDRSSRMARVSQTSGASGLNRVTRPPSGPVAHALALAS